MKISKILSTVVFIALAFLLDGIHSVQLGGRYLIEAQSRPIMRFVKYRKGTSEVMRLTEKNGNHFIVHAPGLDNSKNSYSFESAESPGNFLTITKRKQIGFKKEREVKSSNQNKAAATFKPVGDIFKFTYIESSLNSRKCIIGYRNRIMLAAKSWLKSSVVVTRFKLTPDKDTIVYKWTECSVTCGTGDKIGVPVNCPASQTCKNKIEPCTNKACPKEEIKYLWTECSVTCGDGTTTGMPMNCPTKRKCEVKKEKCNQGKCPNKDPKTYIWSECSVSCGKGKKTGKPAECSNPYDCQSVTQDCTKPICPEEITYSWTSCSATCGGGRRTGTPINCKNDCRKKVESCNAHDCFDSNIGFDNWSSCSRSCDGGTRYKVVKCSLNSVKDCPKVYEDCEEQACPDIKSCPTGQEYRYRTKSGCCVTDRFGDCGLNGLGFGPRIIGGYRAAMASWPWMALLSLHEANGIYTCGATLLNKNWAVTAAHCLRGSDGSNVHLTFGTNDLRNPSVHVQTSSAEKIVIHPDYKFPKADIGLIRLKTPVNETASVRPLCLPRGEQTPIDAKCYTVGWGLSSKADIITQKKSDYLMEAAMRNLPRGTCKKDYKGSGFENYINKETFCVGLVSGEVDTCLGDSGGPLMCQRCSSCAWYLAGITSFGPHNCGEAVAPGVFVNVIEFEDWIESEIKTGDKYDTFSTCT